MEMIDHWPLTIVFSNLDPATCLLGEMTVAAQNCSGRVQVTLMHFPQVWYIFISNVGPLWGLIGIHREPKGAHLNSDRPWLGEKIWTFGLEAFQLKDIWRGVNRRGMTRNIHPWKYQLLGYSDWTVSSPNILVVVLSYPSRSPVHTVQTSI